MAIINIDTSTATKSELTAAVSALMSAKAGIEDAQASETVAIKSGLPAIRDALVAKLGVEGSGPNTATLRGMAAYEDRVVQNNVVTAVQLLIDAVIQSYESQIDSLTLRINES